MLDPNLLPAVRMMVGGIGVLAILLFAVKFAQFWLEARRTYGPKRYRRY
jgi:hypothetical protein